MAVQQLIVVTVGADFILYLSNQFVYLIFRARHRNHWVIGAQR
jgi:hypothetical protein